MESFQLNWYSFLIAFAIGIAYVYFSTPTPKLVIKYPTPYNAGQIVYKDDADTCYKYKAEKVTCPSSKKDIKPQPASTS